MRSPLTKVQTIRIVATIATIGSCTWLLFYFVGFVKLIAASQFLYGLDILAYIAAASFFLRYYGKTFAADLTGILELLIRLALFIRRLLVRLSRLLGDLFTNTEHEEVVAQKILQLSVQENEPIPQAPSSPTSRLVALATVAMALFFFASVVYVTTHHIHVPKVADYPIKTPGIGGPDIDAKEIPEKVEFGLGVPMFNCVQPVLRQYFRLSSFCKITDSPSP